MSGLYIHIPFCASRCIYCGFYSTTLSKLQGSYTDAICHEMSMRPLTDGDAITTIYLGGGTPSQLSRENLVKIFHHINMVYFGGKGIGDCEVTMECNPDDVTDDFGQTLKLLPVNRVSMGAQTFSDSRLQFLHRRHNAEEIRSAVARLRQAGIGNISIDLMFAFPEETIGQWSNDIDEALKLDVEHLSAYSLQYEEGTPLYNMLSRGNVSEVDDELYRQMYALLCQKMTDADYEHYEISNFARPGYRSRHNSSYWHNVPYIGIGASAHSYDIASRSWNISNLKKYIDSIDEGIRPMESEVIDANTHYDDTVMTALRTREGIAFDIFDKRHQDYLLENAKPYLDEGLLKIDNGYMSLTIDGIYVSDEIMADLMWG